MLYLYYTCSCVAFWFWTGTKRWIFKKANFGLDLNSRVGLVGMNGVGKSTLLKLIIGQLRPTDGHVSRNTHLKFGVFTQHHEDSLDLALSAVRNIQLKFPEDNLLGLAGEERIRSHLGPLLFLTVHCFWISFSANQIVRLHVTILHFLYIFFLHWISLSLSLLFSSFLFFLFHRSFWFGWWFNDKSTLFLKYCFNYHHILIRVNLTLSNSFHGYTFFYFFLMKTLFFCWWNTQAVALLSGGQKSRVSFALISWKRPQMLILDEPTNHLDLETIDALAMAISMFKGGVVVVTHDQVCVCCLFSYIFNVLATCVTNQICVSILHIIQLLSWNSLFLHFWSQNMCSWMIVFADTIQNIFIFINLTYIFLSSWTLFFFSTLLFD